MLGPAKRESPLGFVGANNREPEITRWSDNSSPAENLATEAQSAANTGRRLAGANNVIMRTRYGANNCTERCLAERRAA
jgi:hypothetical protein